MQLLDLQIEDYKNLKKFHWEITEEFASPALLLMGKNASGKTNVLEALISIFDFLIHSKKKKSPFTFSITYKIEVVAIKIECKKGEMLQGVLIDNSFVSVSEIRRVNKTWTVSNSYIDLDNILPENIILYYSGFSQRFWDISNKFKQEYSRIFRKQKAVALPPIIMLEPIHYQMILLALFSYSKETLEDKHPIYDKFFMKYFDIENLHSFEIHIKKHTGWIRDHSYNEYFNTSGIVRNFIEQIDLVNKDENIENSIEFIRSPKYPDRINRVIYKFNGNSSLQKIKETFGYEDDIFKLLNILYTTKNLVKIDVKVKKKGIENPIHFDLLSEGEQQFLAIKGMIFLLQGKNTLFLWDEPDTFLNPAWQWDLIPDLENNNDYVENDYVENGYVGNIQRDQFILTTHSPVLLSTVKHQAYYIDKGKISPVRNTYGLTVDESLEKQKINTRIKSIDDDLKEYFELIEVGKSSSEEALKIRTFLEKRLGETHEELQRADVLISFYE